MKYLLILIALFTTQVFSENSINSIDISQWQGNDGFWSIQDGAIQGKADKKVPKNEFLWSKKEVKDFYLAVDVKQIGNNAGIQFRSKPVNKPAQAYGYQADVGRGLRGKLYHEHGRGKLDWNNNAKNIKNQDWNRYEILAVGHKVWTAVNGTLCTAINDPAGELSGKIALQIHSGPPQTVFYKIVEFKENPEIALKNQGEKELLAALKTISEKKPPKDLKNCLNPILVPSKVKAAFSKGFELENGQTLTVIGGSNAAELQRHGFIETSLHSTFPKSHFKMRNIAWPADTVYVQQRPRNFYSATKPSYGEKDGRLKIKTDVVIVWFGQMEALEGLSRLKTFSTEYRKLIEQIKHFTKRIVVVTPVPFEDPLNLGLNAKERNSVLQKYSSEILKIANENNLPTVDLFTSLQGKNVTSDGILLSEVGHKKAAEAFAESLNLKALQNDSLRKAIIKKNILWRQFWLPDNWAFLYGNRQQVPSSRNHSNRDRWFPGEVNSVLNDLKKLENEIRDLK